MKAFYNRYELHWIAEYEDGACESILDSKIPSEAIRTFWTIFGHISTGGVEVIAEFEDQETAEIIYNLMEKFNK